MRQTIEDGMSDVTMRCPTCGREMVMRENRLNGSRFMSCTGWPDFCSHTAKIPAYVEMKAAGGLELPGFDDLRGGGM